MSGWIKIHRKITEWEWYSDSSAFCLFIHLIIIANFQDKPWRGMIIKRGEMITSREHLAEQCGLSIKQIRLAEQKLVATKNITIETTNKFTKYCIVKYEEYQINDKDEDKQTANGGQTEGKQRATTKEYKNIRKKEEYTSDFENFWNEYPRHDGSKSEAYKKYNQSLDLTVTPEIILSGVQAYKKQIAQDKTEKKYIAHAATWLHQRRWEAEYNISEQVQARQKNQFNQPLD